MMLTAATLCCTRANNCRSSCNQIDVASLVLLCRPIGLLNGRHSAYQFSWCERMRVPFTQERLPSTDYARWASGIQDMLQNYTSLLVRNLDESLDRRAIVGQPAHPPPTPALPGPIVVCPRTNSVIRTEYSQAKAS